MKLSWEIIILVIVGGLVGSSLVLLVGLGNDDRGLWGLAYICYEGFILTLGSFIYSLVEFAAVRALQSGKEGKFLRFLILKEVQVETRICFSSRTLVKVINRESTTVLP